MGKKTFIRIDRDFEVAEIDDRIYGSFIEHLGRAVYEGIYEPEHESADEMGFRKDIIDLVRDLQVPIVRYPGGNYVSNFHWEDSVGPIESRKSKPDLAWRTLEPNEVGINEFSKWAKKAECEIMMAVNLGTRGIEDALNLLEYCNLDTDTYYSALRREHGDEKPYGIKVWCMGNEMDGPWQMGQKSAKEYGHLAAETAKAMKMMDHSIETVICGSSGRWMPTFGKWEQEVLEEAYEYVDYISLHQYWGNEENDTANFLAKADDIDQTVQAVTAVCDYVQALKHSPKKMMLSFDEWNVWYHAKNDDDARMENHPWGRAPHLLEDVYNFEDAILDALVLIKFLKHADRIKIACLAQLVNVIAPIMTAKEGTAWKQTIYYPFYLISKYGRGTVLQSVQRGSTHSTTDYQDVTDIESVSVYDKKKDRLVLFAVNRNTNEEIETSFDLRGFEDFYIEEYFALENEDWKAINTQSKECVSPVSKEQKEPENGILTIGCKPVSFHCIVLQGGKH